MKLIKRYPGFTLIELMIVVAIIAFLSMIGVPSLVRFLSKAKRSEAYMNLGSLYVAQEAHRAEHGTYSAKLSGPGSIGWKPEGYSGGGSKERFNYTYGFNEGAEGSNYFTGKLQTSHSKLGTTKTSAKSFTAAAAADLDGDGTADLLTVNEFNNITLVNDDLA